MAQQAPEASEEVWLGRFRGEHAGCLDYGAVDLSCCKLPNQPLSAVKLALRCLGKSFLIIQGPRNASKVAQT
jgi:hypothetical protein